ncbi:MAG TPA: lysophospholipid acyltransferase family protein [Vicinamibacteria bacterium]|nr:lysophospholipid acyltransferase family protein [Vicinamibacteria bacterium]
MQQALSWIFTPPFLIAFGLILIGFDPLQRLARLFGPRPHEMVVAGLQWSLLTALRICGTRFEVERSPAIRRFTPYIVIANHQSMFDVPIAGALLLTNFPKFVSKRELARFIPSISFNLRRGGNALIDRGNRTQALAAIAELGRRAEARGVSVVIYPEGTRARGGELKAFKPAGTLGLLEAAPHLAVVPFSIDGSWNLLRHGMRPVPFGTRVRVRLGDPIARTEGEDREALLARAEAEIRRTIEGWRGGALA